jgi:hypothetical protein
LRYDNALLIAQILSETIHIPKTQYSTKEYRIF